ncbi:MAG: [protein-PII] uridylyltransferase [Verrucomicrobiae bacterium]|nr:[protein-PII] uridylyltransferase [Verrucomicrobiae bacterium]MCB1085613.1 [protein-PII] uridylyltransferase [Verrucomicrobiae bacterium]
MPDTGHFEKVLAHAEASLIPLRREVKDHAQLLQLYRKFLKKENHRIRLLHKQGAGGIEVAESRAVLLDVVINDLFAAALEKRGLDPKGASSKAGTTEHPVTLVASGGYGRTVLNPGSDIDLLFLLPEKSRSVPEEVSEIVTQILLMLYDVGFKVGHAVRTIGESIKFANQDHPTKTALLDARFIAGDANLFDTFAERFYKGCLKGQEREYLNVRSQDIRARHKKWGRTVHLQEPNVKEGCGGLRDYHNLIWVLWVLRQSRDLKALVKEGRLTLTAYKEIENAYEFLMRVRNGLHYAQKGKSGDILTLRHQGILATEFGYPQKTILRRSEAFMRDYYFHTRNLYQHSTSLMQSFELEVVDDSTGPVPFISFLARRRAPEEHFDGFFSRDGLIYPESTQIFAEDPSRMMRTFLHTQQRHLKLSPEIRKLFKSSYALVNKDFRRRRPNRECFEQILQHRGDVARILRQMHRVGFLGRYLPEFGALTDLVQHEFFHRYSADEHTLRCIDQLDALASSEDPKTAFFQRLFRDLEDPYILYLALILHDTGRAENVRHHEDASAMLASQVCTRLRIYGDRRRRLTFLVDHHLTFWRMATTRNIDDPATVAEFAKAMQTRFYMETLFLFSYVDSRATNEEAWSDWKYSLMSHLYNNTLAWFEDREAFQEKANRPRTAQKEKILDKLDPELSEEIEAHFEKMPSRYFRFRGHQSIIRHLRLFHRFLEKTQLPGHESLIPVVGWEARPDEGYSLVEVVGWNRHHFLAKVAGALAARNLNILSADLFTRDDDLVLDIFRVCTTNFGPVKSDREMERVEKLLETQFGVGDEEVDFQALIGRERSPSLFRNNLEIEIPQRVYVSNNLSEEQTVLELQAQDRIGLLYDIFTALGNLNAEVVHARISTQAGAAIDRFYLVDSNSSKKITDKGHLKLIETAVSRAVGI